MFYLSKIFVLVLDLILLCDTFRITIRNLLQLCHMCIYIYMYIYFFCVDFTRCMKSFCNMSCTLQTGVHGRIFSSDGGRPLPGFITVKGMNQSVCLQPCILIIDSFLCNLVAVFLVYKFMHRNSFVHIVSYRHWVSYWKF